MFLRKECLSGEKDTFIEVVCKFMTVALDDSIYSSIGQSVDKHSRLVLNSTGFLLGIFGPSSILVGDIAVVSKMGHNEHSICACLFELIAFADHYVFVLEKLIIREEFVFEGIGSDGSIDCGQANYSNPDTTTELVKLRNFLSW